MRARSTSPAAAKLLIMSAAVLVTWVRLICWDFAPLPQPTSRTSRPVTSPRTDSSAGQSRSRRTNPACVGLARSRRQARASPMPGPPSRRRSPQHVTDQQRRIPQRWRLPAASDRGPLSRDVRHARTRVGQRQAPRRVHLEGADAAGTRRDPATQRPPPPRVLQRAQGPTEPR